MTQPPGNYPPPPPGNYPPPPGDYPPPPGNFPPPPPGGGWGDYPGFSPKPSFSVGSALAYGWERYKRNALNWIGIFVLAAVVLIGLNFAGGGGVDIVTDSQGEVESATSTGGFRSLLFSLISMIVGWLLQGIMYRGALDEVDGRKPGFANFFQLPNIGQILLTSLIVGVLTGVGTFLFIIPGLIIAFLSYFAMPFVVDRQVPAIDGIKASWSLISKNVGPLLLLALAVIGINILGAILLLVGLLVTLPISVIAATYAYRKLSDGVVAPL